MARSPADLVRRRRRALLCCTTLAAVLHGGVAAALLADQQGRGTPAHAPRAMSARMISVPAASLREPQLPLSTGTRAVVPDVAERIPPTVHAAVEAQFLVDTENDLPQAGQPGAGMVTIAHPDAPLPAGHLELSVRLVVGDEGRVRHLVVLEGGAPMAFAAAVQAGFQDQQVTGPRGVLGQGLWCARVRFDETIGYGHWRITGRASGLNGSC